MADLAALLERFRPAAFQVGNGVAFTEAFLLRPVTGTAR